MALTFEQEKALLALLQEKRTTLPELTAATEVTGSDLFLINQMLADKSVTTDVLKQFIAPDASLAQRGLVQLSNNTHSNDEITAATPKAVNQAIQDHANTRHHPEATLTQKGLVQLTNETDSYSETKAATPKAVKHAYDLADSKVSSVNGKTGEVRLNANDVNALALENAPDFVILYPNGSEANPGLLSVNTRIEIDNPYPGKETETVLEVFYNNIWGIPGHVLGGATFGFGATATPVYESNKIVIQTGKGSVIPPSYGSGNPFDITSGDGSGSLSVPYRIRVRKIM